MLVLCYPNCSTCRKALAWLEEKGIDFETRDIKKENPTAQELADWYAASGLELKKFFNTSGMQYKALNLKERLGTMSAEEQIRLLSTDGMLVKRPLVVSEKGILLGFRENQWEEFFA